MNPFSKDKELLYEGKKLPSDLITQTMQAYHSHVVPSAGNLNQRHCYEALIFTLASQQNAWEKPVALMKELRNSNVEVEDPYALYRFSKKHSIEWGNEHKSEEVYNRYLCVFEYMQQEGIVNVANKFLRDPLKTREELCDVKWIGRKTASFWYLCLGGTELVTLDMHVTRAAVALGFNIPVQYAEGKVRQTGVTAGRKVREPLPPSLYDSLEHDFLDLHKELLISTREFWNNNTLHAGKVTTLYWWDAALRRKTTKTAFPKLYSD